MPVGDSPECSFILSWGFTDLNWRNQLGLVSQKVEFDLWGFSKFDLHPTESF